MFMKIRLTKKQVEGTYLKEGQEVVIDGYKKVKIISGFPGIGKSYFKANSSLNVKDSDSSQFSWISEGIRNPKFPQNYIEHINRLVEDNTTEVILVSSHKDVRKGLVANNIYFTLVYPDKALKEEYLQRYIDRGSPESFIKLISNNWDNFLNELDKQDNCKKVILKKDEYLNDVIESSTKVKEWRISI